MHEKWILCPNPAPKARLRLFCFHPAGRGASIFMPWSALLPRDIELCCVQLPGRENRLREPAFKRLQPLVDALEENLYALLDRPFALFGASMGAMVAFELARTLRQAYQVLPVHLFLASRKAPQTPERLPLISHLPDPCFLEEVKSRYNAIPDVISADKELLALFLPLLRADFSVIETYQYEQGEPFDCPLTVFRGADDPVVLAEDVDGWAAHTTRRFQVNTFNGDHFFFTTHSRIVVENIVAGIDGGRSASI